MYLQCTLCIDCVNVVTKSDYKTWRLKGAKPMKVRCILSDEERVPYLDKINFRK